jgi:hypothetical protein
MKCEPTECRPGYCGFYAEQHLDTGERAIFVVTMNTIGIATQAKCRRIALWTIVTKEVRRRNALNIPTIKAYYYFKRPIEMIDVSSLDGQWFIPKMDLVDTSDDVQIPRKKICTCTMTSGS